MWLYHEQSVARVRYGGETAWGSEQASTSEWVYRTDMSWHECNDRASTLNARDWERAVPIRCAWSNNNMSDPDVCRSVSD